MVELPTPNRGDNITQKSRVRNIQDDVRECSGGPFLQFVVEKVRVHRFQVLSEAAAAPDGGVYGDSAFGMVRLYCGWRHDNEGREQGEAWTSI